MGSGFLRDGGRQRGLARPRALPRAGALRPGAPHGAPAAEQPVGEQRRNERPEQGEGKEEQDGQLVQQPRMRPCNEDQQDQRGEQHEHAEQDEQHDAPTWVAARPHGGCASACLRRRGASPAEPTGDPTTWRWQPAQPPRCRAAGSTSSRHWPMWPRRRPLQPGRPGPGRGATTAAGPRRPSRAAGRRVLETSSSIVIAPPRRHHARPHASEPSRCFDIVLYWDGARCYWDGRGSRLPARGNRTTMVPKGGSRGCPSPNRSVSHAVTRRPTRRRPAFCRPGGRQPDHPDGGAGGGVQADPERDHDHRGRVADQRAFPTIARRA